MPVGPNEEAVVPDRSANVFFDTCAYDIDYLTTAIRQRGVRQMVFGTEAPGSGTAYLNPGTGKPADDMVPVIDAISLVDDADKRTILNTNPCAVFPRYKAPSAAHRS